MKTPVGLSTGFLFSFVFVCYGSTSSTFADYTGLRHSDASGWIHRPENRGFGRVAKGALSHFLADHDKTELAAEELAHEMP
jgi:hypothetical protein